MSTNPETPILTPEEREQTKSRILSDAELIERGAEIRPDSTLEVTKRQIEEAKEESEGPYIEKTIVNGVLIAVGKVSNHERYYGVGIAKEHDPIVEPAATIDVGLWLNWGEHTIMFNPPDREFAKKVYDYTCNIAKENNNIEQLEEKIRDFADENEPEESD